MKHIYLKARNVKRSKEKNKKIGTKSIHEIIHNTPELNLKQKVDYIRHHYAYYEGNYEFFYLRDGRPKDTLHKLNVLIYKIIKRQVDAKELTLFNKKILTWKKKRIEKEQRAKLFRDEIASSDLKTIPKWKLDLAQHSIIEDNTIKNIEMYLNSKDNILSKKQENLIPYNQLCNLVKVWKQNKRKKNVF